MATTRLEIDDGTRRLVEAIRNVETEINWSGKALQVFDLIVTTYNLYNNAEEVTQAVYDLMQKVKDFELFLCLDLVRHVALSNGRCPYHLDRASALLQRALDGVQTLDVISDRSPGPWPDRYWLHLAAEIQTTLTEYGFSTTMGAIYDVDEAGKKLDSVQDRLARAERILNDGGDGQVGAAVEHLYAAAADYNGIRQSMTLTDAEKMKARFEKASTRIGQLVRALCAGHVRSDSELFVRYLAGQHLLRKPFVRDLYRADAASVIGEHVIHPGTRGWLMERFNRWLGDESKRLIVLAGKQGTGKTAFASAVCKLYGQHQVACHFFGSGRKEPPTDRLTGLIQSLSHDLCHALPEYLNHLDDRLGSGTDVQQLAADGWRANYDVLLRQPLQLLYGKGKAKTTSRRPLVVIDALDECDRADWPDLKSFVSAFVRDLSTSFCLFVTVRSKFLGSVIPPLTPDEQDSTEGIRLEDRAWINWHIKDIEIYLATSLGAILSGEDKREVPAHAKADSMTLQNAIDELLKTSSGRFDYAIELMEAFAAEMSATGQFLSSLKKAMTPIRRRHGAAFEHKIGDFASPYRAYRDKEGRSVDVRVIRQSQYLMDKTRVALIRGRHKIRELSQNGS